MSAPLSEQLRIVGEAFDAQRQIGSAVTSGQMSVLVQFFERAAQEAARLEEIEAHARAVDLGWIAFEATALPADACLVNVVRFPTRAERVARSHPREGASA